LHSRRPAPELPPLDDQPARVTRGGSPLAMQDLTPGLSARTFVTSERKLHTVANEEQLLRSLSAVDRRALDEVLRRLLGAFEQR
jgi:hypothetical protein